MLLLTLSMVIAQLKEVETLNVKGAVKTLKERAPGRFRMAESAAVFRKGDRTQAQPVASQAGLDSR